MRWILLLSLPHLTILTAIHLLRKKLLPETPEEDVIPTDNPLIDGLGFGGSNSQQKAPASNQDYDLDDIFKMLGN